MRPEPLFRPAKNTMNRRTALDFFYQCFFSDTTREMVEKIIISVALVGFLVHLLLVWMADLGFIAIREHAELLRNPIAAAYTPFSFILIYEVYLSVYYLPRSITTYICKQYEIISLIIIRRLFKDLATLEISANWFDIKGDLTFTYDIIASLLLFYLLYLFTLEARKTTLLKTTDRELGTNLLKFIRFKKWTAVCLIPLLFVVAVYTLTVWTLGTLNPAAGIATAFSNINSVFFDQFFGILIIVDVILLLSSFFLTREFHKVIRNSGFIISTILIRLSFSAEGLTSTVLIVTSVFFGLLILYIHNLYEGNPEALEPR
jgi:hypothetical protein